MDKSWMFETNILGKVYRDGVKSFVQYASSNGFGETLCPCPCAKCRNGDRFDIATVKHHLEIKGVDQTYTTWIFHGEKQPVNSFQVEIVDKERVRSDAFLDFSPFIDAAFDVHGRVDGGVRIGDASSEEQFNPEPDVQKRHDKYQRLAEQKLYPTCEANVSTLSAIVELQNIKKQFGISGNCVTSLLEMIKGWLPKENTLPVNYPAMKYMLTQLGMTYKAIHACPNHCMLYYKEHEKATSCSVCDTPRFKVKIWKFGTEETKEPALVLRYFSLEERLRRWFGIPWVAKAFTWHDEAEVSPENMRHPIDSLEWVSVKKKFPDFGKECRNVWLQFRLTGSILMVCRI